MTLAARFKDLELFVVGIQQQLLRRQDRLANAAPHMQTGTQYITAPWVQYVSGYQVDLGNICNMLQNIGT